MPRVSIIMPVYNAEEYVEESINSILNQTFQDFELIIIDDCSSQKTKDILNCYCDNSKIRLITNNSNIGVAQSRNKALDIATGEFIGCLDHDDIAMPDRLAKSVEFLDTHSNIGLVGGKTRQIDRDGNFISECNKAFYNPQYIKAIYMFYNIFINCEMLVRRKIVEENNIRYLDNCYGMEDYCFWKEVMKYTEASMMDELFLLHRVFPENLTSMNQSVKASERALFYESLQEKSWNDAGINICDDDKRILKFFMSEKVYINEYTETDLEQFHDALRNFVSASSHLSYSNEINIFLKKIFIHYYSKCGFWV